MAATEAATEAQIGFIESLLREKDTDKLTDEQRTWLDNNLLSFEKLNRGQASRVITVLKKLDRKPQPQVSRTEARSHEPLPVHNGRYAVTEGDGILRFYKVNRPTEGKWAGFTFVDVQASDELWPLKDKARKQLVLDLIAADPQEAMLRYGREIGRCGHCGRTLTNEDSRARGIGPICAARMEW